MTSSRPLFSLRHRIAMGMVLLFFVCGVTSAFALTEAGQIIALTGRVVATDANQAERELALRSPVYVGDRIQTAPGARAQVFLLDDTTVSLGEESYMVIDEFVFEGKPQEDVSSLRFLRGVIRNVTGRITQANPSRFQVKTGKAVIGVRGCDILFDIQPEVEQIHVLEVPHGLQIIVDADYRPRNQPDRHIQKRHEIKESGRTVQLFDTGENRQIPTPPSALRGLMQRLGPVLPSDPQPPSGEAGQVNFPTPEPTGSGVANPVVGGQDPLNPATSPGTQIDAIIVDRPILTEEVFDTPQEPSSSSSGPEAAPDANSAIVPNLQPSPAPDSTLDPEPFPTPDPGPDPTPDPGPGPIPDPGPEPNPDPHIQVGKAVGTDWDWGLWQTTIESKPLSLYANANVLSQSTVNNLMVGGTKYYLDGTGRAGAIVQEEGVPNVFIEGTAYIHVKIGRSFAPEWRGTFDLAPGGAVSLNFTVPSGSPIGPDRVLHGQVGPSPCDYQLTTPGGVFHSDSLAINQVNGVLVGDSSLPFPITGVAGNFQFRHGPTGPKLEGVYGTDLGIVSQW